jgi:hypothetical protein
MVRSTYILGKKFVSERVADSGLFHKNTIRTIVLDGHRARVGIPKAFTRQPFADHKFTASTRLISILHPKSEIMKRYPDLYSRLLQKLEVKDYPTSEPVARALIETKRLQEMV